ncbi:hypothetical protein [Algoriphagus machipongonensis]|uniref:Lipoprotein n=1 Tax=Algoriphagus machipongonensis TaxID=388413 RepID=A3I168_9BACT|nr:hypothetical protein [Algoriphagus machipongonensis]EAZ80214.1 hypothetical protein ALPR1_16334 [Algoriphagus machipongonensis]
MKQVYFSFFILLILGASCTKKKAATDFKQDFQIEITDSLQINYLGDLWIQDYDSVSQEFVATTKNDQELLFIDSKGEITSNLKIPFEGPNSMQGIFLLSYRNEMLQILSSVSGFHFITKDGDFKRSILLPYQYIIHNNSLDPAFTSLGEKITYFKPVNFGDLGIGNEIDFVKYLYSVPFLEVLDTVSMERHDTMDFPKTSIYADGNYYFFPFPKIQKLKDKWYLHFDHELKYFVYEEIGEEIVLEKTVDLEVEDAVLPRAEDFEVAMQYTMSNQRPATILQLYRLEGKTIVFYKKGVPEETVEIDPTASNLDQMNQTLAAVFDEENKLIQNGIEVPEGLIFSRANTEDGEILAKKNQDFFGTEEDQVVYYKLKLIDE